MYVFWVFIVYNLFEIVLVEPLGNQLISNLFMTWLSTISKILCFVNCFALSNTYHVRLHSNKGPNNEVLVSMVGEGHRQNMLDFITAATKFYSEKGELNFDKIGTCTNIELFRSSNIQHFIAI